MGIQRLGHNFLSRFMLAALRLASSGERNIRNNGKLISAQQRAVYSVRLMRLLRVS